MHDSNNDLLLTDSILVYYFSVQHFCLSINLHHLYKSSGRFSPKTRQFKNNVVEYFHSSIYNQTKGNNKKFGLKIQKQKIELGIDPRII